MRKLTAVVLGAVAVATFSLGTVVGVSVSSRSDKLPACATEDSENCVWDATTTGNGEGRSFVNVNGHTYYDMTDAELGG